MLEAIGQQKQDPDRYLGCHGSGARRRGIAHADAPQRRVRQQQFLDDLFARMPVHPVTAVIALRAG
jgi:hypothetical protein